MFKKTVQLVKVCGSFSFPLTMGALMSGKQSIIGNLHFFWEWGGVVNDNDENDLYVEHKGGLTLTYHKISTCIKCYISRCCLLIKSI